MKNAGKELSKRLRPKIRSLPKRKSENPWFTALKRGAQLALGATSKGLRTAGKFADGAEKSKKGLLNTAKRGTKLPGQLPNFWKARGKYIDVLDKATGKKK